jgi:hypothetical protein
MSTSPNGAIIRSDASLYDSQNRPIDTVLMRDVVLNNICHYADEFAQVRVNWSAGQTAYTNGNGSLTTRTASLTTTAWWFIASFGPFPLAMRQAARQTGASYRVRVRLAGASSAGQAVTFRAVLGPPGAGLAVVNGTLDDHVFEATTSSTSMGWLTGTSQGVNAWTTQITVPATYAGSWVIPVGTKTDLAGDAAAVEQCLMSLHVFGKTANVTSVPRLGAVYAAEWVGDV